MRQRKIIAITLTIAMILSSFSMVFATETETIATQNGFQDTTNHWAESAINKWAGLGVLKGDERGFRPNDPITRAEMATVLDNIMDYQVAAKNTFSDVPADAWYAEAVLKANAAGILQGDGAGKADPTANITREQSAVMLARAFAVTENSGSNTKFNDAGSISSWARNLVFGMESEGYIQGYNGKFNPKNSITRAEVVTIINNAIKAYYDTAGTYTDNVDGLAIIKVRDVTLKGNTIDGNLIIAEGVGEGDVTLDNVTVKGQTVIRGGGENSIHITGNSSIDSIRIEKVNDQVRIVISDGVTVKYVEVAAGEEIIISGQVDTLELAADNVIVHADAAEINNTNVVGQNSTIIVNKDSKINEITAAAPVEISGEGTVSKVNLEKGADNSTITTPKTNINVAEGVTGTTGTGGKVIPAGETATNGNSSSEAAVIGQEPATGGGGSGGGSSSVAVSAISVVVDGDGEAEITEKGGTLQLKAIVEPDSASNKEVTWSVDDESIATIDQNGLLTALANGTVKVTATAKDGSGKAGSLVVTISGQEEAPVVLDSTITQDPGNTGGDATVTVEGKTITFGGEIAYYEAADGFPPVAGNYVGVEVTAPTGITLGEATTLEIAGRAPIVGWDNFKDGANFFWYYPKVTAAGEEFTFTVKWDGTEATADTFTIKIASDATLEEAPVVLDSTITQDPGNTGGDATVTVEGKTITFGGEIAYYEAADGFPPVAGNYVGVEVTAPTGITLGEATTLEIAGRAPIVGWDNFKDGANFFWYYPKVTAAGEEFTFTVKWDGTEATADTFTIKIASDATLEEAPVVLDSTITQDPGNTGGDATVTVEGKTITFGGEIAYYEAADGFPPVAGNYVGVEVTAPTGITLGEATTLEIAGRAPIVGWDNFKDGANFFWYYPKVTAAGEEFTFTVKWDGTEATADTFTIKIASDATLEEAPVVLDSTITQDPGNTGGDATVTVEGKTITFGGEIAYYEAADGFPPVAGNYVGVEVTAPTGITLGEATTLEIAGRAPIVGWDNFKDGANFFWYYPKVTAAGEEFTFTVKWDGTEATADTFTIKIASDATLEEAPVVLDSTITQDPGNTGGDATVTVEGKTITFGGEIAYYEAADGFPPVAGNYVGVEVTAPTGITLGEATTLEIAGRAPIVGWDNFKDGANFFWYYPKVTAAGEEFTFTVKWDGTEATADTFTIKIASDATLEEAPVVLDSTITQDPGNTGGDATVTVEGKTITFGGEIAYYEAADGFPPVAGNYVGVEVTAPTGITLGEATTLEIAGRAPIVGWDNFKDGANFFWYYPKVTAAGEEFTFTVKWDGTEATADTFTIKIASDATLEEAPVVLDSTITQDPGNTGGDATVTVEGKTITFGGEIAYYEAADGFPPVAGNYVGVEVTAPTGITLGEATTLEIAGRAPIVGWDNFKDGANFFWYYPKVTAAGEEFTFTVKWDGTEATADTFTIKIASDATLEEAPVVLDSTITQDPGNTGGDATVTVEGKTITFGGEIAYYEAADGFPPVAGNYVGVEVTAPTGITLGEATTLEIAGRAPIVGWDNFKDGANFFWYYPKVTAAGEEFTFTVKWDGTEATADTFTIKIASDATLEEAPVVLDSTITQDPGNTGGDATVTVEGKTITFGGEIAYYEAADGFPPVAGNYVGVEVTAPTGITLGEATTLEIAGRAPIVGWDNFKDGANFFWYYPKVTAAGEEFTFTVKWDGTEATADTFTIKIASDATLEEAPVVLDSTITQDPGNTGGDATVTVEGKTITFGGEIAYYEAADGFPPVAGNYVGVEVTAPTGITLGEATTLEIAGRAPIVGWDNFKDGANFFWYYPKVTAAGEEFTFTVKWDGTEATADTFTIKIASDATLEEAPVVLDSTITQDPGNTGGDATVTVEGKTITFGGEIAYYEAADGFPPVAGNYVGVEVTAPTGITLGEATTLEIAGRAPIVGWDNFKDGANFFWYYPKVTAAGEEFTFTVKWDGTEATADTFTIKIASDATLEEAPVVLDSTITQDPGNTGGDATVTVEGKTITFGGEIAYYEAADGFPPVAGNYVGVEVTAPTGITLGEATTLEIAGRAPIVGWDNFKDGANFFWYYPKVTAAGEEFTFTVKWDGTEATADTFTIKIASDATLEEAPVVLDSTITQDPGNTGGDATVTVEGKTITFGGEIAYYEAADGFPPVAGNYVGVEVTAPTGITLGEATTLEIAGRAPIVGWDNFKDGANFFWYYPKVTAAGEEFTFTVKWDGTEATADTFTIKIASDATLEEAPVVLDSTITQDPGNTGGDATVTVEGKTITFGGEIAYYEAADGFPPVAGNYVGVEVTAPTGITLGEATTLEIAGRAPIVGWDNFKDGANFFWYYPKVTAAGEEFTFTVKWDGTEATADTFTIKIASDATLEEAPVVLDSTITQDPGNTGGDATVTVEGKTITFGGEIAYYEAADGFPPVAGNYVGVEVTAPTGITLGEATTLEIAGRAPIVGWDNFKDGANFFWYYPKVTAAGEEFTFTVKWDGTEATADTFTIKIASDATLEEAPVVLDSTITQDPGNTGGDATVTVEGKTITFGGEIAYYEAADGFPPVAGNYVGVEVTAPTGITLGEATTLEIAGRAPIVGWDNFKDGANFFWYYPKVTAAGEEFTFTVKWDGTEATADTFTIKIASDATLEEAPVVLDSTITQDPGNTGGDATVTVEGKTITFGGEIAYYEAADGFPPVAGNYVGVEVTAPTGITLGEATTLEIAGRAPIVGWDNFKDGANFFWYYPKVTAAGEEFTFTVKWDGTEATADTFTIKIASDATLEEAPVVGTKAEFLDELDEATEDLEVATVTRDGDNLTVNFRSDVEPSDVLDAAVGLAEALGNIADPTSTLTVGDITITLGSATSEEIIELATALLGGKTPAEFLAAGETITSAYTASIDYKGGTFDLDGSLNFTVTKVGTKAEFLDELDEATEDLEVATVTRDGDNLTVNFRSDVEPSDVLDAAVGLAEALGNIADPTSTLTVGDITITLGSATSEEIIELATALLGGKTPAEFLAAGETITSAYTASIDYKGGTFDLDGSLNFTVTKVGTKAEFLDELDEATEDLEVATVTRDGDNLTVNFRSDVEPSDVLDAAVGLAEALGNIADPTSTLTVGDITITLGSATSEEIIELATALLGGKTPAEFLAAGETITSAYTASIDYKGGTFDLDGSLNFTVTKVGTKAEFLDELDEATEDLEVATVTRDGDNLTVNFRSDVEPSDVLDAAVGLAEALGNIADPTSTLTVGDITITLGSATSEEIIELATALLGGKTPAEFLAAGETITSAYTASIDYKGGTFDLDGSLNFTVTKVGTKAEFLDELDEATEDLEVATVTRDGDNLTVNFRSDVEPSDVLDAAVGLAEALGNIADPTSTLTVGDITITLGSATSEEIIELATALLGGKTPAEFLAAGETITSAYTASIDYKGGTFDLDGSLNFTVTKVGTKAEFLDELDEATEDLEVATVTRDGDNLTVNFRSDVEPSDVLDAAVGLAEALGNIADPTSTLTVGDITITLGSATSEEIIELATALLGGKTPAEFLAAGETITSAYTASIDYKGGTFDLDGSLNFTVTKVGTKAEFLDELDEATEDLEVATVTRDGDNLTVNFRSDVEPSDVLDAAVGLAEALGNIADPTSTLTVGDITITLGSATSEEIIELATALLGGKTPAEFLAAGETITSAYTASIDYKGGTFDLDGSLNFTVTKVGTKAEFLDELDEATEDLEVATVTRDGDNLTVNFRSDVEPSDVLDAAVGLAEALGNIADPTSTLTVGDITITLGSATSEEIIELATALLGGKTPAEFLAAGETITSAYTASIDYKGGTFDLDGSLNFTVTKVGTKAEFLDELDEATEDLEVATVTRDGDNLTVNFRSDVEPSDVLDAAVGLAEALGNIADPTSTLTVGDITITLGSATSEEIIELATALLGGKTPAEFLAAGETITSAYTASIDYKGGTFDLDGTISFTAVQ